MCWSVIPGDLLHVVITTGPRQHGSAIAYLTLSIVRFTPTSRRWTGEMLLFKTAIQYSK